MSTKAATAKAIDWKHVAVVVLRAAWWLLKMAFKLIVMLGAALLMVVAFIFSGASKKDQHAEEHLEHQKYGANDHADYDRWR